MTLTHKSSEGAFCNDVHVLLFNQKENFKSIQLFYFSAHTKQHLWFQSRSGCFCYSK
uniref:Uncharacterized protein n=1 Tax=Octopus bimaculoides TaxID=37653 RepID=A0A0L8FK62_OCTBM